MCALGSLMYSEKLGLILKELRPFKLSHFRQLFCIIGYGVCVITGA